MTPEEAWHVVELALLDNAHFLEKWDCMPEDIFHSGETERERWRDRKRRAVMRFVRDLTCGEYSMDLARGMVLVNEQGLIKYHRLIQLCPRRKILKMFPSYGRRDPIYGGTL